MVKKKKKYSETISKNVAIKVTECVILADIMAYRKAISFVPDGKKEENLLLNY